LSREKKVFNSIVVSITFILLFLSKVHVHAVTSQTFGPFDVTFYNSGEGNGLYTSQQNWTSQQITDVGNSINAWSSLISNTPGRQIKMHVFWDELDSLGASVLGGSASPTFGDGATSWTYSERIWRDGVNYDSQFDLFDTVIRYDITAAGQAWNFGQDLPDTGEIDFQSVVTHEIGHSLGWTPTYDPNPIYDDWGNTWGTSSNTFSWVGYNGLSAWDKNLVDSASNRPVNGGTGTPDNFNQLSNPVYWDGQNAASYYGSNIPIYGPNPYNYGSSLSHLDPSVSSGSVMGPFAYNGQANRVVSGLEWAMMQDMGWDIIPEPATFTFLWIGVAIVLSKQKSENRQHG
jgi:hypothetical protein